MESRIIGRLLFLLGPEIPKHQRREEDACFIRVPHRIPISEDTFRFTNQPLNPVSVEVISEIVVGVLPLILQTNEAPSDGKQR